MMESRSCFISAGERSGDLLAADLVSALKETNPELSFTGIAGQLMRKAGVKALWPLEALNVMGLVDVLKQAPDLRMLERRVMSHVDRHPPHLAILVDYPGFHFRLAEQFKLRGIPVVQYVAPKVWAWGSSRVAKLRRDFELVLGILPFEGDFFELNQVPWKYVGCPHIKRLDGISVSRRDFGLPEDRKLIACLPGSRMTEVTRILPILGMLRSCIASRRSDVDFVVPVSGNLPFEDICALLPRDQAKGMHFVREKSLDVMSLADAAIVASGTATLECALLETPMVVVYSMDEISYQLAKSKLKVSWASLVNLCLNREAVPEFIQDIDYETVTSLILDLLDDGPVRKAQKDSFVELRQRMGQEPGAALAAQYILPFLSNP